MSILDLAKKVVNKLRAKPRLLFAVQGILGQQKPVLSPWRWENDCWWRFDGEGRDLVKVSRTQGKGFDRWTWMVVSPPGQLQQENMDVLGSSRAKGAADAWLTSVGITLLEEL